MKQYLLDTDICIYFMKGLYNLDASFKEAGSRNCFISEITVAELKFGVAKSKAQKKNQAVLNDFLSGIQILPIFPALDIYAEEKARLKKSGNIVDDFDLLIGATAIAFDLVMISNNINHFKRLKKLELENWVSE